MYDWKMNWKSLTPHLLPLNFMSHPSFETVVVAAAFIKLLVKLTPKELKNDFQCSLLLKRKARTVIAQVVNEAASPAMRL